MPDVIAQVAGAVEAQLKHEGSGHDWQHVYRVWQTAQKLAEVEGADATIVSLAALLHDVDDYKVSGEEAERTLPNARRILAEAGVAQDVQDKVFAVVGSVGFRKTLDGKVERTLEGHVVSDADMLDGIGAVGIARTFTYCGGKGFGMFDPEKLPRDAMSKDGYMKGGEPSVTHFFEKLLKLRWMMFTEAGKAEAKVRHGRMVTFLDNFFEEAVVPPVWKELLEAYR